MSELALPEILLLVIAIWTSVTTLLAWLLLRANRLHRARQQVKYPYEVEMEDKNES